jgi:serine/threonine-protein kinase RsbW
MAEAKLWTQSWRISGSRSACQEVIEAVQAAVAAADLGDTVAFAIRLALEEALANAVRHGHIGDENRTIEVIAQVSPSKVQLEVADEGPGFDPTSVPDPTRDENLTIASGRGLSLMRAFMTEVQVVPPGNRIVMTLLV